MAEKLSPKELLDFLYSEDKAIEDSNWFERVKDCKDDPDIELKDSKLFYKGVMLDKENIEIPENIKPYDTVFLFGFGNGDFIEKFREKFKKTVLVIFETNPCIVKATLLHKNLSKIEQDKKTLLALIDEENMENQIEATISILRQRLNWGNAAYFTCPGYNEAKLNWTQKAVDFLKKHISVIITNRNTLMQHSKDIQENNIKNLSKFATGGFVEKLDGIYKNKPAVIVASGPSLSKNIHLLKEIENKVIIIAADSAISILKRYDIVPDFVCGVDHKYVNEMKYTEILKEKKASEIVFAGQSAIFHSIPKLFKTTYLDYDSDSFVGFYDNIIGKHSKKQLPVNAVTHFAIKVAYIIGSNPIIFIGQDWAYSGGADHAAGTSVEGIIQDDIIWIKGNYEKKVPTSFTLLSGLKITESIVRELSKEGFEFINATEGGAYINGCKLMSLKEATELYAKEPIEKLNLNSTHNTTMLLEMSKQTQQIIKTLEKIYKDSKKALTMAEDVLKRWLKTKNTSLISKDVEKINKINDEITYDKTFLSAVFHFYFKEFYEFNLEEIDIEGQDNTKRIKQAIKYFKLISSKTTEVKKHLTKLYRQLKLEKEYRQNPNRFLKKIDNIIELLEIYYDFKNIYDGIDLADEAIKLYPEKAELYYLKGKLLSLNRFMHKETLENFQKALELKPDLKKALFDYNVEKNMVLSHLVLAKKAADAQNFTEAKMLLNRALDYEPDNKDLKKWLNVIEQMSTTTKNIKKQNILFEQLKLNNELFEQYSEAIEYVKKEEFDKAYDILLSLYEKAGAFGDIPFLLGSISMDKNKLDDAEKYLNEAVELIPYQALVYMALGKLYLLKEEYIKAKENLEKAIQLNPNLKPSILDHLGNLYYEFEEYEKAFRAFEEYLQYSDDKIKTLTKLALCYKEMGMIKEYNQLMEKLSQITKSN